MGTVIDAPAWFAILGNYGLPAVLVGYFMLRDWKYTAARIEADAARAAADEARTKADIELARALTALTVTVQLSGK